MSFLNYVFDVLKKSISFPWRLVDTLVTILGIIGAFFTWYLPNISEYFNVSYWLIPVMFFTPVFIIRLFLSPYWLLVEEKHHCKELMKKLKELEEPLSRIVFHSIRDAQLYKSSNFSQSGTRSIYHIWQIWFTNSPLIPNETSTAKNITSTIEFKNIDHTRQIIKVYGVWSVDNPPDFVGSANLTPIIDMPPGNIPAKLNIALKFKGEDNGYAFSIENMSRDSDGRDNMHQLPPGNYEVLINLKGNGVDKNFCFHLINPGKNSKLNLESLNC
jgi:hypothetical protein